MQKGEFLMNVLLSLIVTAAIIGLNIKVGIFGKEINTQCDSIVMAFLLAFVVSLPRPSTIIEKVKEFFSKLPGSSS